MKISRKLGTSLFTMLIASIFVTGCATPGAPRDQAGNAAIGCNPAIGAGIGAVFGALIGGGTNTVRGAAIGASLGGLACMALNYQTEQVKSSQQVQNEYKAAHKGRLPEQATLIKYETSFTPTSIQPGQKAQTSSYIEVAPGTKDANPVIEEELTLYKPDGEAIKTVRKPVVGTSNTGAFKGGFSIPMPKGVPQGIYPVKTVLYINNKRVAKQDVTLQIVYRDGFSSSVLASAY